MDQCPFQPLFNKCGKAVLPSQDWPSYCELVDHRHVCVGTVGLLKNDDECLVLEG